MGRMGLAVTTSQMAHRSSNKQQRNDGEKTARMRLTSQALLPIVSALLLAISPLAQPAVEESACMLTRLNQ